MAEGYVYTPDQQEPDFKAVYESLQADYFEGQTWWFGWHTFQLEVPQPLSDHVAEQFSSESWEHLRVFSDTAELRLSMRANKPCILLLTESPSADLPNWQEIGKYEVEDTHRILLGETPKSACGPTPELIEITFPRPFNYGIDMPKNRIVIARVKHYRDEEWRLQYTRYCTVDVKERSEVKVKAYETL